jgi:hypothetical protein
MTGRVIAALRNLLRRSSVERDLDSEVRSFFELAADERIARGMSAEQAMREIRLATGGLDQVKESVREQRAGVTLDTFGADVRYALRAMWRTRVLTMAAVLSIALGVGANTGVFTVVNALFLHPLPVARPESVAALFSVSTLTNDRRTLRSRG